MEPFTLPLKKYADTHDLAIDIGDWETPSASEEKARNARYTFLEALRVEKNAEYIVTGHHKNDQAETVLLQFFRSGGIKSLSGMREYNKERHLWRPLLEKTKDEMLEYLHTEKIKYCTDTSNADQG